MFLVSCLIMRHNQKKHQVTTLPCMLRYFALLRLGFSAWEGLQLHQQRKRQRQQHLTAVHALWTCKQAWTGWRRDFLPWAGQKRTAHDRAISHWRSNVLAGTMCAWREVMNPRICVSVASALALSAVQKGCRHDGKGASVIVIGPLLGHCFPQV